MNFKNLQRTLAEALEHHRAGRHEEAARLYASVRRAAPKVYDGWYLSGTLEVHRDRPEAAIPLLQQALRLSPTASQCKLFLGLALSDVGRFAEAEKPLRAGLEKHPNYAEAWENLANALIALERPAEAAEAFRRVLALQPGRDDVRERIESFEATLAATLTA